MCLSKPVGKGGTKTHLVDVYGRYAYHKGTSDIFMKLFPIKIYIITSNYSLNSNFAVNENMCTVSNICYYLPLTLRYIYSSVVVCCLFDFVCLFFSPFPYGMFLC